MRAPSAFFSSVLLGITSGGVFLAAAFLLEPGDEVLINILK